MRIRLFIVSFLLASIILLPMDWNISATAQSSGTTERVSVASNGTQATLGSEWPSISADGRYVAFASPANNLVSGDTGVYFDVFVHNRQTHQTTRVSVASNGSLGNQNSTQPSISADGRYVAFNSFASNLLPNDTNSTADIFVHDQVSGQTTLVSVASNGTQGNGVSARPSISADGRYIAFDSTAYTLVSGDTNFTSDVFVHDRQTGQTTRVSVASDGSQGNGLSGKPSISSDGRYVAFTSLSSNLVANDTNGYADIFVHDRQTGQTTRVSVASNGSQTNASFTEWASISGDGTFVAFESLASNLVPNDSGNLDVFVHNRLTSQTIRVSVASDGTPGNNKSELPFISADGRYVAFYSDASNLVSGDTNNRGDMFVYDRLNHQTTRVSIASDGSQAIGDSSAGGSSLPVSISANGRYVAFISLASNLVPGDTNGQRDIFVRDREGGSGTGATYHVYLPLILRR